MPRPRAFRKGSLHMFELEEGFYTRWGPPKIVLRDHKLRLVLTWWDGHGIHAFNEKGKEVAFWNVEDDSPQVVRASMMRKIRTGDYPWAYEGRAKGP